MAQTCQTGFQAWLNVNFENAVGGPPSYASLSQKHQKGVALLIVNAQFWEEQWDGRRMDRLVLHWKLINRCCGQKKRTTHMGKVQYRSQREWTGALFHRSVMSYDIA